MIDLNELKTECLAVYEAKKKNNKKEAERYKKAYNELLMHIHGKKDKDLLEVFKV